MDAEQWNERYAATELWGAEPNRFVPPVAGELAPGRALDLACGEGRNAIWLAQRGWKVTAVDFAEVAVERGRARASELGVDVDWVVGDVLTWVPPARAFDLVLICYLQVPERERRIVWQAAAGAVAPNGTFFCVGHDLRNVADGVGGPQDPAVCYRADEIVGFLDCFDIVFAGEAIRTLDVGDAIDCLVHARR